jgi:hypothetical protein
MKDLREESEELTHGNILRDDVVTLTSSFLKSLWVVDVINDRNLFLQKTFPLKN